MKNPLLSLLIFFSFTNPLMSQPTWWGITSGGTRSESAGTIVSDPINYCVYSVGFFTSDSITFGTQTLINNGTGTKHDLYIVKYDFYGNFIWARSAGSTGDERAISVTLDPSGNILVGGQFTSDTLTFGSIHLINWGTTEDLFLVKYDPSGNVLWAKSANGSGLEYLMGMTTDHSGNTYMTGYIINSIFVFAGDTISAPLLSSMFLLKYDDSGNPLWAKGIVGAIGKGIANDNSGNLYLTGDIQDDSILMDTIKLYNTGAIDIFIAKYDSTGNCFWAKGAGGSSSDAGISISTNGNDRIFAAGNFRSPTIQFDTISLTNTDTASTDIFMVKLDENGNILSAFQAGSTLNDGATCVSVDQDGSAFLTGYFLGPSITFGSHTLQNLSPPGTYDSFLTGFTWYGGIFTDQIGGTGGDVVKSVCTSGYGHLFMTGSSWSPTLYIGQLSLPIPSVNQDDLFIYGYDFGVSTGEELNAASSLLYPNPMTAGNNSIILSTDNIMNNSISGYDLTGKAVNITIHKIDSKKTMITFDAAPGIYFISVTTVAERLVFKVIKE